MHIGRYLGALLLVLAAGSPAFAVERVTVPATCPPLSVAITQAQAGNPDAAACAMADWDESRFGRFCQGKPTRNVMVRCRVHFAKMNEMLAIILQYSTDAVQRRAATGLLAENTALLADWNSALSASGRRGSPRGGNYRGDDGYPASSYQPGSIPSPPACQDPGVAWNPGNMTAPSPRC